jgi:PEP-CTERM motif
MTLKTSRIASAAALACFAMAGAQAALNDVAIYTFNLPSTAVPSQTPPYPVVATLKLTEVAGGVQFLLTPNWLGSSGFNAASSIKELNFVYEGLAPASVTSMSGAVIDTWTFETDKNGMDSNYKADDQWLSFKWKNNDFMAPQTSQWLVSGSLANYLGTKATSNSHPTPMYGVISVDGYSLAGVQPTPSNWVAGTDGFSPPVPEPGTYLMMVAGLAAVGFIARRRKAA